MLYLSTSAQPHCPLCATPLDYLRAAADSVLNRTYEHLQLVLVIASPELPELTQAIEDYRKNDSHVTVVNLAHNLGITEKTNRGIDVAAGNFCRLIDHDNSIETDLQFEYATR